jgi:hypothetical protein
MINGWFRALKINIFCLSRRLRDTSYSLSNCQQAGEWSMVHRWAVRMCGVRFAAAMVLS